VTRHRRERKRPIEHEGEPEPKRVVIDPCVERTLAAVLVAAGVAVYDFLAGPDVSLWALYLGPIAISAWGCGVRGALALAMLSAVLLIAVDALVGTPYSTPARYAIAQASQFASLFCFAAMAGWVQQLHERVRELEGRTGERRQKEAA